MASKVYLRVGILSAILALVSLIVLSGTGLEAASLILAVVPLMIVFYKRRVYIKKLEENFRIFLDDLRDLLQGGISIPDSVAIAARNDYGPLTIYVRRLAAKVKLGIPFEKAMSMTFRNVESALIKKILVVINETLRAGGNFMSIFTVAIDYVEKIERLKRQRRARASALVMNSYVMFYVFVGIILAIEVYFVPILEKQEAIDIGVLLSGGTNAFMTATQPAEKTKLKPINYRFYFTSLIVVQALFAGPAIGKIAEDSYVAGLKHSAILLSTALMIYLIGTSLFAGVGEAVASAADFNAASPTPSPTP